MLFYFNQVLCVAMRHRRVITLPNLIPAWLLIVYIQKVISLQIWVICIYIIHIYITEHELGYHCASRCSTKIVIGHLCIASGVQSQKNSFFEFLRIWMITYRPCWLQALFIMDSEILRNLEALLSVNKLWPGHAKWRHWSGSTSAQVMAYWLTALRHHLN